MLKLRSTSFLCWCSNGREDLCSSAPGIFLPKQSPKFGAPKFLMVSHFLQIGRGNLPFPKTRKIFGVSESPREFRQPLHGPRVFNCHSFYKLGILYVIKGRGFYYLSEKRGFWTRSPGLGSLKIIAWPEVAETPNLSVGANAVGSFSYYFLCFNASHKFPQGCSGLSKFPK